jgi:peptide-O-fucosyltransferase
MAFVNSFTCSSYLLCLFLWTVSSKDFVVDNEDALTVSAAEPKPEFEWDPKGYVMFCLCMGRFGNQAAHFLGGMAFAKALDRTLVVPPFITYKQIPYKEWFELEPLKDYHRIITMEDFMEHFAPTYWPPGNRTAFCYRPYPEDKKDCSMKEGNPFGPFWNNYNVDFDHHEFHGLGFDVNYHVTRDNWKQRYPPSEYPVIALKGAPAHYPEMPQDRDLQRYMKWSGYITSIAEAILSETMRGRPYLGMHLRIGSDWTNACKHGTGKKSYMESLHCLENTNLVLTDEMCLPSTEQIARATQEVLKRHGLSVVYIGSDVPPPLQELRQRLGSEVDVYWTNPERPQVDLYILEKSEVFIGSCASSFTAFVKRARVLEGKSSLFWGLIP